MITGIGIDTVEIKRFSSWHTYSHSQLQRILSPAEITYCMQSIPLSPQRFAARFATREAFFKAWVTAFPEHYRPFLTMCRAISIAHGPHHEPQLFINWPLLGFKQPLCTALVSITHTKELATAIAYIQKLLIG